MVPCHGSSGPMRAWGVPVSARPSAESGCDHMVVGVVAPPMFWSDFHSIQVPWASANTRGSMEPPSWD